MTTAELHEILDDENRKITLKEYQEILYQLKSDVIHTLANSKVSTDEERWYAGEMNGFQLALDLSEHIKEKDDG
jgi:hypothetical protein